MIKLPQVTALTLCHRLDVDPTTGFVSLIGVFHALWFQEWPSPAQNFTAYVALYDGVGEGTMELAVTRLRGEDDIYYYQRWFTLPGRWSWLNLVIPVTICVFPHPGRYALRLRFDGKELTRRYLDVHRQ
jgi:hypothetical protein